jgi:hypothetical protein
MKTIPVLMQFCISQQEVFHVEVNFTLKMEEIHSSKTLAAIYKTTQHHNPKDQNQHV